MTASSVLLCFGFGSSFTFTLSLTLARSFGLASTLCGSSRLLLAKSRKPPHQASRPNPQTLHNPNLDRWLLARAQHRPGQEIGDIRILIGVVCNLANLGSELFDLHILHNGSAGPAVET